MNTIAETSCIDAPDCGSTSSPDVTAARLCHVEDRQASDMSGPSRSEGPVPPECEALRWYVLRHRSTEGRQATIAIKGLGFEVHHFREEVTRRAYEDTLRAFFPGYLFARFSLRDPRWGAIMRLRSVTGILCSNFGQPVPVSDAAMDHVRSKFDDRDLFIPETPPPPASRIGRMFTVEVGPWARFMGQCVSEDPKGRVSLLLTLFGRSHVQEFQPDHVGEVAGTGDAPVPHRRKRRK